MHHSGVKKREIFQTQVVAGIQSQTGVACHFCRFGKRSDSFFRIARIEIGVWLCIQFHTVGSGFCRGDDIVRIGVDKNRRSDAGVVQPLHRFGEKIHVGGYVPSGRAGQGVGRVGHEGDLRRPYQQDHFHEIRRRIALYVKFRMKRRLEGKHVCPFHVAFVGTRMHGDAVGAESLAVEGHVKQARSVFTPCVAQGRYFVDINT